jgi:hypothetical protein
MLSHHQGKQPVKKKTTLHQMWRKIGGAILKGCKVEIHWSPRPRALSCFSLPCVSKNPTITSY